MSVPDSMQARVAERLFRIWFSHPNVEGIFYWNLVEGTNDCAGVLNSEMGENIHHSGLLKYDFTEKEIFQKLYHLLHKEWHTDEELDYMDGKLNTFKGFYGTYECTVSWDGGEQTFELEHDKDDHKIHTIVLSADPAKSHHY